MQQHDTRMPDATGDPRGQKYPLYHAMEDDTALFSRVADVRQQTGSWSFARWGLQRELSYHGVQEVQLEASG